MLANVAKMTVLVLRFDEVSDFALAISVDLSVWEKFAAQADSTSNEI